MQALFDILVDVEVFKRKIKTQKPLGPKIYEPL